MILIDENAFENVICKMAAIFYGPHSAKYGCTTGILWHAAGNNGPMQIMCWCVCQKICWRLMKSISTLKRLNTIAALTHKNKVSNINEIDIVSVVDSLVPNLNVSVPNGSVTPFKLNLLQCSHVIMRSLFSQILRTDAPWFAVSIRVSIAS